MALIACPDCGKDISSNAQSCIHCGAPINAQPPQNPQVTKVTATRSAGSYEAVGTVLILIGMVTGISTGADNHIGGWVAGAGALIFLIGRFK